MNKHKEILSSTGTQIICVLTHSRLCTVQCSHSNLIYKILEKTQSIFVPQYYNQGSVTLSTTVVLPALNKRKGLISQQASGWKQRSVPLLTTTPRSVLQVSQKIPLYTVRCLQVRVSQWSWGAVPLSDSRHAG